MKRWMKKGQAFSEDDVTLAIAEHLEITVWRYPAEGGTVVDARFAQSSTTEHAGTTPHGDYAAKRKALETEIEQTRRDTRAKVGSRIVDAIERARRAGTIPATRPGAQWTTGALSERLEENLDVDSAHIHAPGAPPGDYFATRSKTTVTFAEFARARCAESEAESTACDLRRETRRKVALRVDIVGCAASSDSILY